MLSPISWKDGGLDINENDPPLTVGLDVIVPLPKGNNLDSSSDTAWGRP